MTNPPISKPTDEMTRLEATLARLNDRTHGRGADDPLLKEEGIIVRLSDVLILIDDREHLLARIEEIEAA